MAEKPPPTWKDYLYIYCIPFSESFYIPSIPHSEGYYGKSAWKRFVEDMVNSTRRQFALLVAVALCAALTGAASELCSIAAITMLPILLFLIGFCTYTIYCRAKGDTRFFMPTMLYLFGMLVVCMFFPSGQKSRDIPVLKYILTPCRAVIVSLTLPYIAMTFKQLENMHILLSLTVFLPSVIAGSLANGLPDLQTAFYLVAASFLSYKYFIRLRHVIPLVTMDPIMVERNTWLCWLANIGVGAVEVFVLVFDCRPILEGMFILSSAAAMMLTNYLTVKRYDEDKMTIVENKIKINKYNAVIVGIELLAAFVVMGVLLTTIFFCLEYYRPAALVPTILFISILWVVIKLHSRIREKIPNCLYFIMIMIFLFAALYCTSLQDPLLRISKGENATILNVDPRLAEDARARQDAMTPPGKFHIPIPTLMEEAKALRDTLIVATMLFWQLFIYLLYSALVKTDALVEEAAEHEIALRREEAAAHAVKMKQDKYDRNLRIFNILITQ